MFTLLVLGVAILAAREYLDIAEANGLSPFRRLCYVFVVCVFMVTFSFGEMTASNYNLALSLMVANLGATGLLVVIASPFLLLIAGMRRDPLSRSRPDAAVSFLLRPYIALSLASMVVLRSYANGALFLLFTMLLVWTGDTAAYLAGRAFGRRKMAPSISPGKTWEGALGAAVACLIYAIICAMSVPSLRAQIQGTVWLWYLLGAAFLLVASIVGDLFESALKRRVGAKDSGAILPGHGGVLDRIDSATAVLPLGALLLRQLEAA